MKQLNFTTHISVMNSYELHDFYMYLHEQSRGYKDAIRKINIKRARKGKTPLKGRQVETDNFQHPEVE